MNIEQTYSAAVRPSFELLELANETLLTLSTADKCKLFQFESLYLRVYNALLTISQNSTAQINQFTAEKKYTLYTTMHNLTKLFIHELHYTGVRARGKQKYMLLF